MKNNEVRQPFLLNHDGEKITDIFKVESVDELKSKIEEEEGWGDVTFAFTLFNTLNKNVLGGAKLLLFVSIIEGVYDEELGKVSELVQLLTNAILDEERRGKIIKLSTMLGLETATDDNPEKIAEIMAKAMMMAERSSREN